MSKVKGRITFRTAAVLLLISAVLELLAVNEEVPLIGGVRSGMVAMIYHLVYAALFGAAGIGLWAARRFGYWAVMAGTAVYTLDRGLLLLDRNSLALYLSARLRAYGDVGAFVNMDTLIALSTFAGALFIVGWLGFALYTHWRRAYFRSSAHDLDVSGQADRGEEERH